MVSRACFIVFILFWAVFAVATAQSKQKVYDLPFSTFNVVYDYSLGIPVYISYDVHNADVRKMVKRQNFSFKQDRRLPSPRPVSSDYTRSGYDRGHMCPSADRSNSIQAMRETFTMSNVCPQIPSLNVGQWLRCEERERYLARQLGKVHVRIAPLFFPIDTQYIGKHRIAVPHGFIKVIYRADSITAVHCELFSNL